jgi:hypothetical protein
MYKFPANPLKKCVYTLIPQLFIATTWWWKIQFLSLGDFLVLKALGVCVICAGKTTRALQEKILPL